MMRGAIFTHQACPVKAKYHRQLLYGNIVHCLVKGALHKR
jgi:hypothetical protein